jgi:type II secretory pathway pseudopilin PulG
MNFPRVQFRSARAFTMIEIAICLAIIGFALIAVILALPFGLNAQRDNRQGTVVGQDATALIEFIRNGALGVDDLTNHVYAIVNLSTNSAPGPSGYYNPVLAPLMHVSLGTFEANFPDVPTNRWYPVLTSATNIIGLLSTPELVDTAYHATNNLYSGGWSNHIVAYVRSLSGLVADQAPQDNPTIVGNTFAYRIYLANAAVSVDTNVFSPVPAPTSPLYPAYVNSQNLNGSLHEMRLTFRWPVLPNGAVANQGSSPLTFRASLAGTLGTNGVFVEPFTPLYFYQSQTFTASP